jgi:hypothetical protein
MTKSRKQSKNPQQPKQPDQHKSSEPFTSEITDEKRREIIERVESNSASDDDAFVMMKEFVRASTKIGLATLQKDGMIVGPFTAPDRSAASAGGFASTLLWAVEKLSKDGAKHGRDYVAKVEKACAVAKRRREKTEDKIADEYRRIKAEGCKPRARAKTIALTLGRTPQYVGRVIKRLKLS